MKEITIRDLYAGKPDAKDEIDFEGTDLFIKTFVVAEHFYIESLINGSNCFITGYKGTGKTALLFYLANKFATIDPQTCNSFIFFKEEYTDVRRSELANISKRLQSSITVESGALVGATEFEYIWRWLFFKRIIDDNEKFSRNLFEDNSEWKDFEQIVNHIVQPDDKRKIQIPNNIKVILPIAEPASGMEMKPEFQVDLRKQESQPYKDFAKLVDDAEKAFSKVQKTDIPYYLFIDELEAYYGDLDIFQRDLYMIRDLVFTVKRFNSIFNSFNTSNIKAICSIRTEIITAITRFIVTKEINKAINGFSLRLNWDYANSNSYAHPIIKILLKRIAVCTDAEGVSDLTIYRQWFPEKIHELEPANYILNNSWLKPRDMIRLIITAQNSLFNDGTAFTKQVFDSITKAYSTDSLEEIKEELRALYKPEEIDNILTCLTGFRTTFSLNDLNKRVAALFKGTILEGNMHQVLNDLYRLGVLGNFLPISKTYRWQHRGDDGIILSEEWRICVHLALHSALSLGARNDYGLNRGQEPQPGDVSNNAEVNRIDRSFVHVLFRLYGREYRGVVHVSEIRKLKGHYIQNLRDEVSIGDTLNVIIKKYDEEHSMWQLAINMNEYV